MLAPMIGIVHIGRQALADRYSYLPMIGLDVAIVWGGAELIACVRARGRRRVLLAAAGCALAGFGVAAFVQSRTWRDSETAFRHTRAVSSRASVIRLDLGSWLREHHRLDETEEQHRAGLEVDPGNPLLHFNLGKTVHAKGRISEAIEEYRVTVALEPTESRAPYQLGVTFEMEGRLSEAAEQYRRAAAIDPSNPKPRERFAAVLAKQAGR